jgi:hypothetical protein
VVGILEPGQFFGEDCLNGHPLRMATTTAMEECTAALRNLSERSEGVRQSLSVSLPLFRPLFRPSLWPCTAVEGGVKNASKRSLTIA